MLARNALLVDDSKSARYVLGKLLEQHDFNVEMMSSAEDAIEFLATHKPDAIFMDHMMKGMDGLVATSVIKKNPTTAHIPVVMCTSNDGEKYLAEAKSHGALGTLVKPPSEDKLAEILVALNKVIESNQPTIEPTRPQKAPAAEPIAVAPTNPPPTASPPVSEAQIEEMVDHLVGARIALIEESLEAQIKQQQDELTTLLEKRVGEASRQSMSRQEIADLLESHLAGLSQTMSDQLTGMKRSLSEEIIASTDLSRHVQAIAMETAIAVTEEKAALIARNTARSSALEVLDPALNEKIQAQLLHSNGSNRRQALIYAALAAIVGAGTAVGLFIFTL
ncbi:MAG: response regulator [Gammaproteobacteria bacterium]|nr:response regulator [Gammaproteobacteria bacterium]MCP5416430.1 response regulator [Chromatiaceae bacterium]